MASWVSDSCVNQPCGSAWSKEQRMSGPERSSRVCKVIVRMKKGVLAAFILLTLLSGTHGESANPYLHRDPPSTSSCPEPGPVANAYRRFDDKGNVKYTCNHGYNLTNGNDTRQCQAGTYDGDPPVCTLDCRLPGCKPDVDPSAPSSPPPSILQCLPIPSGAILTCNETTGQWEPTPPWATGLGSNAMLNKKALPKLQIANETVTNHTYNVNDTVTYTCDDGLHAVSGSGVSRCEGPFWTTPTLICKEDPKWAKEVGVLNSTNDKWERNETLNLVADDLDETCTEGPFSGIRIEMNQEVEVSHILVKFEASQLACPLEFPYGFQDSCYHVSQEEKNFSNAKGECEAMGGKLAEIETQEQNEFLRELARSGSAVAYWLGGSDEASEGTFVWVSDGRNITFSDWSPHGAQPDNNGNKEDCLEIRVVFPFNSTWNDNQCTASNRYICQITPTIPPSRVCPSGFPYVFENSCYHFSVDKKKFFDSERVCTEMGAKLAEVESEAENEFLLQRLKSTDRTAWLGGFDTNQKGQWVWRSDNRTFGFEDWGVGEPKDDDEDNDYCLLLQSRTSSWNDVGCEEGHTYTCEISPVPSVRATIESRANRTKSCSSEMPETLDQEYIAMTCPQMPAGKAVNIHFDAVVVRVCEIRIFGRRFDGALGCLRTASGLEYKGHMTTAADNSRCLQWNDTDSDLQLFPDANPADVVNYCRRVNNMPAQEEGPACYVKSSEPPQSCGVQHCSNECLLDTRGLDYTGNVAMTSDGRHCVAWTDANLPFRRNEDFPNASRDHNFCRNPGGSQAKPWCYTNATSLDYGHCDIPLCQVTCPEPPPVPHAHREYTDDHVGTDVTYTCFDGYAHTNGSLTRRCLVNGLYSGDPPVCTRECRQDQSTNIVSCLNQTSNRNWTVLVCPEIPNGFKSVGVAIIPRNMTFTDAKAKCEGMGGKLAEPRDAFVNNALKDIARTYGGSFWIGVTDVDTEGKWVYVSDNSTVSVRDWASGQPDNGLHEDCAVFRPNDYKWHDVGCEGKFKAFCQCDTLQGVNFCPPPPVIPRMQVDQPIHPLPVSSASYTCAPGFQNKGGNGDVKCLSSGEWETPTLWCKETSSPVFRQLRLIRRKMTFQDAEDACADEGGQLVSIHDVFTQDTVALVCRGGGASRCWIGLKRALYDEWTDGSIVNYTNYEKDDLVTYSWNEKCVSIGTEEFPWKWNSTDCDSTFYPVCKMSPSDSAVLIRPEDTGLHLIKEELTFDSAETECKDRGGHLVSIHDEETRNRTVELCRPAVSAGACGCWIGLQVFENKTKNNWTDDSPFGEYQDCNRSSCDGGKNKTCVRINPKEQWMWDDATCERKLFPICSTDTTTYSRPFECLQTDAGWDYKGDVSFTRTGRTCLRWDASPIASYMFPGDPDGNKCRNPFGSNRTAPWCYVSKQPEDWDYCSIPPCSSLCEMPETLLEYAGQRNTTSDGTPCVHWQDLDTNHTVASYRKEDFPGGDMRHNYCRNPGRSQSSLWCYTNKSGSSYGHCSVPQCPTGLLHFHESDEAIPSLEYCYNPETHGPSSFNQTREAFQKFCNDTVLASCYTGSYMAAVSIVCDVCGPPPKVARMKSPDGVYRANDSATYTCDDDFYPISDGPTTITCRSDLTWTDFPEQSLRCEKWENFAREKKVSSQENTNPPTPNELTDDNVTSCVDLTSGMYKLHLGSKVEVGMLTLHFDNGSLSLPHSMSATVVMENNATKNCSDVNISTLTTMTCPQYPVGKEVQILIESDDSSHFRLCEWRVFGRNRDGGRAFECLQSNNGLDYKGNVNFTATGRTCLSWDAAPTILSADLFPDASLADAGNKCRNPIGYVEGGPWCFINNTDPDWELCFIRPCSEWCYFIGGLFDYAGTVNTTRDGACLAWPNDTDKGLIRAQDFSDNSMDHNFCRNPDRSEARPWCYVNDACKERVKCTKVQSCGAVVIRGGQAVAVAAWVKECYNPSTHSITTRNTSETAYKEECLSVMQSAVTATCFGNDALIAGNPVAVNIECETCLYPRPVPGLFVDGSRPYEVGSNALYKCPRGQVIGNITCVAAGNWSEVNFTLSDCYGTCPPPPDLPRLTAPNVLYKAGQSVTYTCRDGLYPIGGDTTVTCILDEAQNASVWSNIPEEGLQCEDYTNFATDVHNESDHFASGQLQDLVDDDVSSCVEVASGNYTLMVKTRLEVEAMSLHFNLSAESILGSVHVDVLKNQSAKFCGETSDLNNITYITCTRAPVGNGVRIQLSHDSGDSANFSLCEIRVFGRRFRTASKDALQCLRSPRGLAYKGGINFTSSGRTCLRWDSPDTTNIAASKFPDATIRQAGNKCRNPSDVRYRPWCFFNTTDPKWEYCHVPLCDDSCQERSGLIEYSGHMNVTVNQLPCLPWTVSTTGEIRGNSNLKSSHFPNGETDHNYCRNPDRSESGPWCFTSANETENCSVSECATTISFHHEVLKPAIEACYNPATNQTSNFSESRAAYQAICPTIPNLNVTTFCYLNTSAADNSTKIDMVAILMRCDEKRKKKYPLIPCNCDVAKNLKELTPQKAQERAEQFKKDLQLDDKTLAKAKRRKISAKNMKAAHKYMGSVGVVFMVFFVTVFVLSDIMRYCLGMESRTDTLRRIASGRRRRRRENQGQVSVIEEQSPGNDDAAQATVLNKDETADNMSITRRRVQKPGPSAAPREDARPSGLPAWASIEEPGPSRPRDDLNQDPFPHARIPPSTVPGRPRPDDSSDDSSDDGPMMCRARASLQQKPKTTTVVVDLEMLPRRTQLREQTTPDSPEEPESYI